MEYLQTTLAKIHKNKYEIFFWGDFNIDLLQHDSHEPTNDFINSLISHSELLIILLLLLIIYFPILQNMKQ